MGRLSCHVRRWRAGIAVAVLASLVVVPSLALADRDGRDGGDDHDRGRSIGRDHDRDEDFDEGRSNDLTCPGRHTLVRIDEAICPPNGKRPLIVRKRACCQNPAGKVHCDHFEHCPRESPS